MKLKEQHDQRVPTAASASSMHAAPSSQMMQMPYHPPHSPGIMPNHQLYHDRGQMNGMNSMSGMSGGSPHPAMSMMDNHQVQLTSNQFYPSNSQGMMQTHMMNQNNQVHNMGMMNHGNQVDMSDSGYNQMGPLNHLMQSSMGMGQNNGLMS